jgi:hypothetical protein
MKIKRKVHVYETSDSGACIETWVDGDNDTRVTIADDTYFTFGDLEEAAELFTKLAAKARKRKEAGA